MPEEKYEFSYEVYDSIDELNEEDAWLLNEAKEVTQQTRTLQIKDINSIPETWKKALVKL